MSAFALQVGVVKPYAVVELPPDAVKDGRNKGQKVPRGVGRESKPAVEKGRRQTISGLVRRGSAVITPKRKAPPPPPRGEKKKLPSPHPVRRNSAMRRSNGVPAAQSRDNSQLNGDPLEPKNQPITSSSASPPLPSRAQHRGRALTLSANSSSSAPAELELRGSTRPHTAAAPPQQRSRSMTVSIGRSPSVSPQPWHVPVARGSPQARRRSTSASRDHPPGTSPQHRARAATVSTGVSGSRRKYPPQKPPRTLSTFISTSEQDALLTQLLTDGTTCSQQPLALAQGSTQLPSDPANPRCSDSVSSGSTAVAQITASRHERSSSSGSSVLQSPTCSVFVSPGQLHSKILQLLQETLRRVCEERMQGLMCTGDLWGVGWGELEVRSRSTLSYKGIPLSLEVSGQLG